MTPVSPYLKTLRRVPDDIILSVATREFAMSNPSSCVCGWVLRESLARAAGISADEIRYADYMQRDGNTASQCAGQFGGSEDEWSDIFVGVTGSSYPAIEEAFVDRVDECVR